MHRRARLVTYRRSARRTTRPLRPRLLTLPEIVDLFALAGSTHKTDADRADTRRASSRSPRKQASCPRRAPRRCRDPRRRNKPKSNPDKAPACSPSTIPRFLGTARTRRWFPAEESSGCDGSWPVQYQSEPVVPAAAQPSILPLTEKRRRHDVLISRRRDRLPPVSRNPASKTPSCSLSHSRKSLRLAVAHIDGFAQRARDQARALRACPDSSRTPPDRDAEKPWCRGCSKDRSAARARSRSRYPARACRRTPSGRAGQLDHLSARPAGMSITACR